MLGTFPAPSDCYLYGPVCVADTERGRGLAGASFSKLCAHMGDRRAMIFVRADNANAAYAATPENLRSTPPDGQTSALILCDSWTAGAL
jgi:hypothetical protein